MNATRPLAPAITTELSRLARTELSMRTRVAHVLLALVASALTIVVTSLWLTEPELPARTRVAFGMLASIGLGWVAFSLWVLRSKHVMLARHRVVAGRLAVCFCGVFVAGCVLLALVSSLEAARSAAALGCVLLTTAIVLWWRAEKAHARLVARRHTLDRELNGRTR